MERSGQGVEAREFAGILGACPIPIVDVASRGDSSCFDFCPSGD